jgi:MFS family permease
MCGFPSLHSAISPASSGGMGMRAGGLGLGGLLLVLVLSWATGIDFLSLVGGDGSVAPPSANVQPGRPPASTSAAEEKAVDMVDAVMDDAQSTWQQILGGRYQPTTAVLFRDAYQSGCGFAQSAMQLAVFRVLLGIGMGGEWATGAALVSESFPAKHRGKALAFVQSSWAIGYGLAALVNLIVMPVWGWRGVFFVGVLPALFTIWIRRRVEEPAIWHQTPSASRGRIGVLFAPGIAKVTVFITLMNACTLFGWWGLNSWVPAYLSFTPAQGGIGLSSSTMSLFVIAMQAGMWLGYVSFGYFADAIGRKRAYIIFVLAASVLLPAYGYLREPSLLLVLGPLVAFFGTGYYSGFGAVIVELYPTSVRATAAGVCYNTGRIASAAAPYIVGSLAATRGFGAAFGIAGFAFLLAAIAWVGIPETSNPELT